MEILISMLLAGYLLTLCGIFGKHLKKKMISYFEGNNVKSN